jgi:hypothetical protein
MPGLLQFGGEPARVAASQLWRRFSERFHRGSPPKRPREAGGESVSQSLLKDKAFSTFLDQNPPFELRPENGISPSTKACAAQWPVVDDSASSD